MHRESTLKHGSQHVHEGMRLMRHHIDDHLHSRHFWAGVVIALAIVGILTLLFILAGNAPYIYPTVPYVPYG